MNTPELKEVYTKTVVPALMKKLDFVNVHQVPKIEKINRIATTNQITTNT